MNIKTADGKFVAVDVPERQALLRAQGGGQGKATYNNNVIVRLKPPGEAAVDTADTTTTMGKTSGSKEMERKMTAEIVDIDKSGRRSPLPGRTGGNTVDGSSIRPCSIRSRWATRSTSPGTPTSRSRWKNSPGRTSAAGAGTAKEGGD